MGNRVRIPLGKRWAVVLEVNIEPKPVSSDGWWCVTWNIHLLPFVCLGHAHSSLGNRSDHITIGWLFFLFQVWNEKREGARF